MRKNLTVDKKLILIKLIEVSLNGLETIDCDLKIDIRLQGELTPVRKKRRQL